MKVTIPEDLKKDVPATSFGKILSATPVVMAVIATMLAGLASSEMTRAQYDRALAAQQQSKAGDQWSFFQAKRLRGAYQRNTADMLQAVTEVHELDPGKLKAAVDRLAKSGESARADSDGSKVSSELLALLDSPEGQDALARLKKADLPGAGAAASTDARVKAALGAVENLSSDAEIATILAGVDNQSLDGAVRAARDQAQAFDAATKPLNQTIDRFENLLDRLVASLPEKNSGTDSLGRSLSRDFTAARLAFVAQRYEIEARLNQAIANLYELQVRKSNLSAERHHARSQRFFFGMLAAQLGVIISTFAIAARQRNLLWSLAAVAGFAAVGFAIYVYLKV